MTNENKRKINAKPDEATARIIASQITRARLMCNVRNSTAARDIGEEAYTVARTIGEEFAALYAQENPRFNRARFFKACGMEAEE